MNRVNPLPGDWPSLFFMLYHDLAQPKIIFGAKASEIYDMHGIAYYITWTVIVLIYVITSYMLYHSEKGGYALLGVLMFCFYAILLMDVARLLLGYVEWFGITEGVGYGSLGGILVYGAIVWIAIITSLVKKKRESQLS